MAQDRPNIVWLTSEDNSKHYLNLFDPNGVATPTIEKLAESGLVYDHAFSNGPVCSVARSTLITGAYAPRIGAQYHRKLKTVPMPENLEMFPVYLRRAGYYTANNSKEDYNLEKGPDVWDESSNKASYKNRKPGQPFFYVHNFGISHEGQLHFDSADIAQKPLTELPSSGNIQPNHPQTELFAYTRAYYLSKIQEMDRQVGALLAKLEEDGLMDNTFVFYFGDHGGVLPGSKGYLYETGLHVPLVIHIPSKYKDKVPYKAGERVQEFVSFVDFAPTVLNLAGIAVPKEMDGRPFLDVKSPAPNKLSFGYADRFDEKYDMVRSVRKGKYKYIRNFQPFNFDGLWNDYRYKQMAYQEWLHLYQGGELTEIQEQFFRAKPAEMLFDVEKDPYETENLVQDPLFQKQLKAMRKELNTWLLSMPDLSFYPEYYLMDHAFENPVVFGQKQKINIAKYLQTADLMLEDFQTVKDQILKALEDEDPWNRYWALIVLSSYGKEALSIAPKVSTVMDNDPVRINRVRAAQFLGIGEVENPMPKITEELYKTENKDEALLILNILVQLRDGPSRYKCNLRPENMLPTVAEAPNVASRLDYILKD
ncbi:sulfatase [Echinicola sediminis]